MTGNLDQFRKKYAGSLVGKLFVLVVVLTIPIGLGAAGLLGVILTTEVVGWETEIARVVGFGAVVLAAISYAWLTGPPPWRPLEYW